MSYIVAAAIQMPDGVHSVPRPGRHNHIIHQLIKAGYPKPIRGTQGFLTSTGVFVNRIEAMRIARAAGQLIPREGRTHKLYSEDLW